MKVKLFILISILIISFGLLIFFFGFRKNLPENARDKKEVNATHQAVNDTINTSNLRKEIKEIKQEKRLQRPIHHFDESSPHYTAAVVELEVLNEGDDKTPIYIDQMVEIINSPKVKEADIIVLPEALLNRAMANIVVPNSAVFCDDPDAHFAFRNISCAARNAKKYVVMNMYTRVKCLEDDQVFCANLKDKTNIYNMVNVFDRNGAKIATYRKYNQYNENVQVTEQPEIVTFKTDFNVTFGVIVCFDLILDEPANILLKLGIRNFVFSTMWHNQLPYGTGAQYQQMWAYSNNVNLVAANDNWLEGNTTGSGIYAGRAGALKVFISQMSASHVTIAKVPINLPSENEIPNARADEDIKEYPKYVIEDRRIKPLYDESLLQMDMSKHTIKFIDFSKQTAFNGTVCNKGFCCNYDIEISENTDSNVIDGPVYSYAISAFGDYHQFDDSNLMLIKMSICSLIACTEMNERQSCAMRFGKDIQHRYSIDKLNLNGIFEMNRGSNIFPTTLTNDLYPLNAGAFEFRKSYNVGKYSASMNLTVPKSDLLTFGILSRDYKKDRNGLVGHI